MIVSAFATRGLSADVMRLVLAEHELVTADVVLREVERVLTTKFRTPPNVVSEVLAQLREHHVEPVPRAIGKIRARDPDDARVLASAIAAGADVVVTGDRDLLEIQDQVEGIRITDPRGFWAMHRRA